MPGGSEKVTPAGFATQHPIPEAGGGSNLYETAGPTNYDFSIGDFTQNFPPIPPLPDFPDFPPFPEPGDITIDNSSDVWVFITKTGDNTPIWINLSKIGREGGGTLPTWFDVHEEDGGDTHVVEIDEVAPANDLVLRLHGLPSADPGDDGVWLSAS